MGHLAFAAAIEAIISNLLFRGASIDQPPAGKQKPQSYWLALGAGAAQFFHVPAFLRPCRDKGCG